MRQREAALLAQIAPVRLPERVPRLMFVPPHRWRFGLAWIPPSLALEVDGGTWASGRHSRGKGYEMVGEKLTRP